MIFPIKAQQTSNDQAALVELSLISTSAIRNGTIIIDIVADL